MHTQKRETASDAELLRSRLLAFNMVGSTRANGLRGSDAESLLRRMRVLARAWTKPRAWRPLLRKRPKQRAAGGACGVERLVFLISARVGHAGRSRRLSIRWFVWSFLLSRRRVLHVFEHLFDVRADRRLAAAFPELHFRLLSSYV